MVNLWNAPFQLRDAYVWVNLKIKLFFWVKKIPDQFKIY